MSRGSLNASRGLPMMTNSDCEGQIFYPILTRIMDYAVRLHVQGHAVPPHVFQVKLCKSWVLDCYFALIVTIYMLCQC